MEFEALMGNFLHQGGAAQQGNMLTAGRQITTHKAANGSSPHD
jgi:hypothetical protein